MCEALRTAAGHRAYAYDNVSDPVENDFNNTPGFLVAIWLVLCLGGDCQHVVGARNTLATWGTVCSSFVWAGRGSSGRSWITPEGWPEYFDGTAFGNLMTAHMICTWQLMDALSVTWLLEQPGSSLLKQTKLFYGYDRIIRKVSSCWSWMGNYGAHSAKGTEFHYPTAGRWGSNLRNKLSRAQAARLGNDVVVVNHLPPYPKTGKPRVSSGKDLKKTAAYTKHLVGR